MRPLLARASADGLADLPRVFGNDPTRNIRDASDSLSHDKLLAATMFAVVRNGISQGDLSHLESLVRPCASSSNAYSRNIADVSHMLSNGFVKQIEQHLRSRMAEQQIKLPKSKSLHASGAQIINAAPHGKASQYWHRDACYEAYTAIIPFCDLSKANGCTQILPNSTRGPIGKRRRKQQDAVLAECQPGDVVVFDSRLIHRGLRNTTSRDRLVLALEFADEAHAFKITG